MKRSQVGLESLLILGTLLIGALLVVNQVSTSTADLSKGKAQKSLETLANAIRDVQVQGTAASQQVEVYIPPEVDPQHTGKSEANTLVLALLDGSEIVVPVDSCVIGTLPNEPGIHMVTVRGGQCASIGTDKFYVSPAYVIQKLEAGAEASLPITVQTIEPTAVKLTTSESLQALVDLNTTEPANQYEVLVMSPATVSAKILIPEGTPVGIYEGYINAETSSALERITIRIEVYTTQLEVKTFQDSNRLVESDKFSLGKGLYYRAYLKKAGTLSEGTLQVSLSDDKDDVPIKGPEGACPDSTVFTPTGIYEGHFKTKDNRCYGVPGTIEGFYTLTVTDKDTGITVTKKVKGMNVAWLELKPSIIEKWMSPNTQVPVSISIDSEAPETVELSIAGDVAGMLDLDSTTGPTDSTRTVNTTGTGPLTLSTLSVNTNGKSKDSTFTGTLTATTKDLTTSIPVKIVVYTDDIGWRLAFEPGSDSPVVYSGAGAQSYDLPASITLSSSWKNWTATNCGKNVNSNDGFCKPSQAWGKCTGEPASNWYTIDFNDAAWTSQQLPAKSNNYGDPAKSNWFCADCTGFFRKDFTLSDTSYITSVKLELAADEGARCYLNGVELDLNGPTKSGTETDCQTYTPPKLLPYTFTSSGVISSLRVGKNVLACAIQERRKYGETEFKYFDARLTLHKEVPAVNPTASIYFKLLNQRGEPISGVSFSGSDVTLKKLDEVPHPTLNQFAVLESPAGSGIYEIKFSPSELATLSNGGSGTYGFVISKPYEGVTFDASITFNIDDPLSGFPFRFEVTTPSVVNVAPDTSFTVKAALLDQLNQRISGRNVQVDISKIGVGIVQSCSPATLEGEYYTCIMLSITPGQYLVYLEDKSGMEQRDVIYSFTFNAVNS